MGDPELAARAEQAAIRLERAWDRWRRKNGLTAEQAQPVSSYVGYSLVEPWGRPRVVFGMGAQEAEQLCALLEQHEPGHSQGPSWQQPGQERPSAGTAKTQAQDETGRPPAQAGPVPVASRPPVPRAHEASQDTSGAGPARPVAAAVPQTRAGMSPAPATAAVPHAGAGTARPVTRWVRPAGTTASGQPMSAWPQSSGGSTAERQPAWPEPAAGGRTAAQPSSPGLAASVAASDLAVASNDDAAAETAAWLRLG